MERQRTNFFDLSTALFVFIFLAAYFWMFSQQRLIARDEGFYTLAAKLVAQGKQPYRDFFYPQAPFLPYVFAVWLRLFGSSWHAARGFPALLAAMVGLLIFLRCHRFAGRGAAFIALVIYCISALVFPWYVVAKSYALAALFVFASFFVIEQPVSAPRSVRALLSGLFIGLAASTRLYLIALAPIALWYCFGAKGKRSRGAAAMFIVGALTGLLPLGFALLDNPHTFWFNNVAYHLGRSEASWREALSLKWFVLQGVLGLRIARQFSGIDLPMLFWLSFIAAIIGYLRNGVKCTAAVYFALITILVSLVPTPSYIQYFSLAAPFMIVVVVETAAQLAAASRVRIGLALFAVLGFLCVNFHGFSENVQRYTRTGVGVIGIVSAGNVASWRIETMEEVAEAIDLRLVPGEKAAALWPGYLFASHAAAFPGTENQFGRAAALRVRSDGVVDYKVMSRAELAGSIKRSEIPIVAAAIPPPRGWLLEALSRGGYVLLHLIADVHIWSLPAEGERDSERGSAAVEIRVQEEPTEAL